MLEDVGIQLTMISGIVGQQRTAKTHQFNIEAVLLFGHFLRDLRHILLGTVNHTHFDMLCITALLIASCQQ